jgi:hypothetical protein
VDLLLQRRGHEDVAGRLQALQRARRGQLAGGARKAQQRAVRGVVALERLNVQARGVKDGAIVLHHARDARAAHL